MVDLVSKQSRLQVALFMRAALKHDLADLDKTRDALVAHFAKLEGDLRSLETAAVLTASNVGSLALMEAVVHHGQYLRGLNLTPLALFVGTIGSLAFDTTKLKFPSGFDIRDYNLKLDRHRGWVFMVDATELKKKYEKFMAIFGKYCVMENSSMVLVVAVHMDSTDSVKEISKTAEWDPKHVVRVRNTGEARVLRDTTVKGLPTETDYIVQVVHMFKNTNEDGVRYNRSFMVYEMYRIFDEWGQKYPQIVVKS